MHARALICAISVSNAAKSHIQGTVCLGYFSVLVASHKALDIPFQMHLAVNLHLFVYPESALVANLRCVHLHCPRNWAWPLSVRDLLVRRRRMREVRAEVERGPTLEGQRRVERSTHRQIAFSEGRLCSPLPIGRKVNGTRVEVNSHTYDSVLSQHAHTTLIIEWPHLCPSFHLASVPECCILTIDSPAVIIITDALRADTTFHPLEVLAEQTHLSR
mmetsp:Transcript_128520/g.236428  ORF Transcript_128520/g.236428 Transcript_128520/m.236428 type:complete len:217 (-) Transcript_128520:138-788(-)